MSYTAREIKKMNKLANSKEVKKLRAIQDWAIDEEERLGPTRSILLFAIGVGKDRQDAG